MDSLRTSIGHKWVNVHYSERTLVHGVNSMNVFSRLRFLFLKKSISERLTV